MVWIWAPITVDRRRLRILARGPSEGRAARGTRLAGEAFALLRDDHRLLLLMQLVQRIGHFAWIERLLALMLNFAWSVATFFVVPTLALEDIGPLAAVRRSSSVIRGIGQRA